MSAPTPGRRLVWTNELGHQTFTDGEVYEKHTPWASAEAQRLRWAGQWTPVPQVLSDTGGVLRTTAIHGQNPLQWRGDPAVAVRSIGAGLRSFHDALPVEECPWVHDVPGAPPVDRLVVCHGDPCVPNTLLTADGSWVAHVDLTQLGVADRWLDLAVLTGGNLAMNFGPGHEDAFLAAYGVARDDARISFYREFWDRWDPPVG